MDYATPDRRRSKNDKKAKSRFNRFKRGGFHRTQQFSSNQTSQGSAQGS